MKPFLNLLTTKKKKKIVGSGIIENLLWKHNDLIEISVLVSITTYNWVVTKPKSYLSKEKEKN